MCLGFLVDYLGFVSFPASAQFDDIGLFLIFFVVWVGRTTIGTSHVGKMQIEGGLVHEE